MSGKKYNTAEDFIDDESFHAYVFNAAEQDKIKWEKWLKSDPGKADKFYEAKEIIESFGLLSSRKSPVNKEDEFNALSRKINHLSLIEDKKSQKANWFYLKIAATIILLLSLTVGYLLVDRYDKNSHTVAFFNEFSTQRGSKAKLVLQDGTHVWLNSSSKIKYPVNFDKNKREIFLEGEAFFEVTKDKNRPFLVNTDIARIKVLGTTFNVKSYPEDLIAETTLETGLVSAIRSSG